MSIILVIDVKLGKEKLLWRRQTTSNHVTKYWIISIRERVKAKTYYRKFQKMLYLPTKSTDIIETAYGVQLCKKTTQNVKKLILMHFA